MARITVFALDLIDPPNHGYRVDVSRRLHLLGRLGYDIQLVEIARTSRVDIRRFGATAYCVERIEIGRAGQVGYMGVLWGLLKWPWPTACRQPVSKILKRLNKYVADFSPEIILIDGLYSAPWAMSLAEQLNTPYFYRSHNIEHVYMHGQWQAEKRLVAKFRLALCLLHLRKFEGDVIKSAQHVFDISATDLEFWKSRGGDALSWLPPLSAHSLGFDAENFTMPEAVVFQWDIGYFGNLNAPNNVEAIEWLVRDVLLILRKYSPDLRVLIAGSGPTPWVQRLCSENHGVELISDPESIEQLYEKTRVLVNPALRGSGVNLKTIDMLASGRPIAVSAVGLGGLPMEWINAIAAPATPEGFAHAILTAMTGQVDQAVDQPQQTQAQTRALNELVEQNLLKVLPPAKSTVERAKEGM